MGDVVRVPFPFVERTRLRARPALIVSGPVGPDGALLWSLMITSARRGRWPGDIAIGGDHARYGLPVPCFIRTAKIAALEASAIERRLGQLPADLSDEVKREIRDALGWR
nr:type II toxin-antitoxin system PemK/MazF family toxin [Sphingomonas bacterium]